MEYIAFVDGDDYIDANYISELPSCIIKCNAAVASCDMTHKDGDQHIPQFVSNKSDTMSGDSFRSCLLAQTGPAIGVSVCNKLYKKERLNGDRFDSLVSMGEDLLYYFKLHLESWYSR